MALISCPECGHDVSETARKCPECGYTLKKYKFKKWLFILGLLFLLFVVASVVYYFFVYSPQQIPLKATALLEEGKYIEADALFARLKPTEENRLLREQLFYESRIVNAAKAVQENLIFPNTMMISEVVIWDDEMLDTSASTETQKVYSSIEPEILFHYLAQSKGGSMVDGYVRVSWENDSYVPERTVDDLEGEDSLPWYIDSKDYDAAQDFWSEQVIKAEIVVDLYTRPQIGSFDLERCNNVLKNTFGKAISIIPAGDVVVTPSPSVVTVTPKPEE